jgi:hypothetical protein
MGEAYEGLGDKTNAISMYEKAATNRTYKKLADWHIDKLRKQGN